MMLRSQVLSQDASSALGLVVANLGEISAAFGEGFAARVLVELAERVERVTGLAREAVAIGPDGVYFPALPEQVASAMRAVADPVCIGSTSVVMALALPWSGVRRSPLRIASNDCITHDMAKVAALYDGIREGRSCLVVQPICNAPYSAVSTVGDILYWECLSRVADANGRALSPAEFIPALERCGLTRCFDAHVVSSTVDLLEASDAVSLGCNISAQSAFDDEWWDDITARLRSKPDLAARLVIEITETSPVLDVSEYVRFVRQMRFLGCRIALDDFGTGFHSIDLAQKCPVDIIKIDAGFLPRSGHTPASFQLFKRLVSLAQSLTEIVVVEGVETETERRVAAGCGPLWMQGYHLAKPSPALKLLRDIPVQAVSQ